MKLKSIYTKNGVLTHEYFVNESDKEELVAKMGLANDMEDSLGCLLSNYNEDQCVLIETHLDSTLLIDGTIFSSDMLTPKEEDKDEKKEDFDFNKKVYRFNSKPKIEK